MATTLYVAGPMTGIDAHNSPASHIAEQLNMPRWSIPGWLTLAKQETP